MPDRSDLRRELLGALPDLPRWVETRGMLRPGDCQILGSRRPGCVVRSVRWRLLSAVGRPAAEHLDRAVAGTDPGWTLITPPEETERLQRLLPDWLQEDAILHVLPAGVVPAASSAEAAVRPIEKGDIPALGHLPPELRREITAAAGRVLITAAFADNLAVSFCYSCLESETLWDVSVDTLAGYRRRGLAAACAAELIGRMRRRGKEPVWGAGEGNRGSLRLARKLGFVPVDRLAVFTPPAGSS